MLNNFLFLIKIIRVLKKYNLLILISKNIRFKLLFTFFTKLISIGVPYDKNHKDKSDGLRIAQSLNELGPSFVKLGQLISTRPDIVGIQVLRLSLLRDNLPPFSRKKCEIIEDEFGKILVVFSQFSEPIATSIAQVHLLK